MPLTVIILTQKLKIELPEKNSQIKEASKIYPFKKKKKSESLCFRIVSSTLYFKNYFNLMIVRVKG